MTDEKIVAVVGATGAQGGGLARAILDDEEGGFAVRALTRNPGSEAARALAARGADVVQADVSQPTDLARAFHGAYGAYCVTSFWEHFSTARELADARNMADAAKAAGLRHVVWSTLEDTRLKVPLEDDRMPTLQERYKVPHLDAKGEADAFWAERDVPTTYLLTSYYWDNLIHFGAHPQRAEDGSLTFVLPMGDEKMPGIAAEDIGRCAYGVFKEGASMIGRRVGIAGEHLSGAEMATAIGAAIGEPVAHYSPPWDEYRAYGFPGADDLGNMFQYYHDFAEDFRRARSIDEARRLNPALQTFDQWLRQHADRIPIDPA